MDCYYYRMMAKWVLSAVAVAVPVVDLVVAVAGKEHRKEKAFRKLMLEPPVLDLNSRRQKWMQEQVDQRKVDRTLNLQLG